MNLKFTISAVLVAAGVAAAGCLAYALSSSNENDDIVDLSKAKITLTQAVGAAEAHATGKATKAELEGEQGTLVYQVEVVTADNKVFNIEVDASDGKVLSSKQDLADGGEKDD